MNTIRFSTNYLSSINERDEPRNFMSSPADCEMLNLIFLKKKENNRWVL